MSTAKRRGLFARLLARYLQALMRHSGTALRHYGVETRQVWAPTVDGDARNRRGVLRTEVAAAVAEQGESNRSD